MIDLEMPGVFSLAEIASFGYCSRRLKELRHEGPFTPPSLEGSLVYPATIGGTEWGGGAVDPKSQVFVVNSSSAVQIYQLIERGAFDKLESGGGETGGLFPMAGGPYGINLTMYQNAIGMLWNRPFGQIQKWGFYMPQSWGTITIGGPVITASGLIFIGASMDAHVGALDFATGDVLWKALVGAPAVALPAVYEYQGKQYVVLTAGGNSILAPRVSDEIVAFALPD